MLRRLEHGDQDNTTSLLFIIGKAFCMPVLVGVARKNRPNELFKSLGKSFACPFIKNFFFIQINQYRFNFLKFYSKYSFVFKKKTAKRILNRVRIRAQAYIITFAYQRRPRTYFRDSINLLDYGLKCRTHLKFDKIPRPMNYLSSSRVTRQKICVVASTLKQPWLCRKHNLFLDLVYLLESSFFFKVHSGKSEFRENEFRESIFRCLVV
jgi:hypothetical protein